MRYLVAQFRSIFESVFQQQLQVDDFARCIQEDKESIVGGIEGYKDMLIIDAIHKAIVSGNKEKIGRPAACCYC